MPSVRPRLGALLAGLVLAGLPACTADDAAAPAAAPAADAVAAAAVETAAAGEPVAALGLPERLVPERWLVLEAVDARGRRPLRPDAVYARHIWQPDAEPPREGEALRGENGEEQRWQLAPAGENGAPVGDGSPAWASTEIEVPVDGVMIANLQRALTLHVNGRPFTGDYYGYGQGGVPVPLRAGSNHVFVSAIRGKPSLVFTRPEGALMRAEWGDVRSNLVQGSREARPLGLALMNTTEQRLAPLVVELLGDELFAPTRFELPQGMAPLAVARLSLPQVLRPGAVIPEGESVERSFTARAPGAELAGELKLTLVASDEPRLNSFVSAIDGTVQKYGVHPPADAAGFVPEPGATVGPGADAGLVLSLHGAGVNPMGQARAYSARPDFWVVVPTNRSPFGFDWQDWGRQDAYEVLADALAFTGTRRGRVYLAGHSMGGHGTWHLAALDPDGFAAAAPSAGWESFDSYGGRPEGDMKALWHAADAASDTLSLIDNLVQVPTFVVHGTADDNVPPEQAHTMLAALEAAGASPQSHFAEGKGHWWNGDDAPGADCVDWPGIFELFRRSAIPERVPTARFTCVDPGLDSTHHGLEVVQARRGGEAVTLDARWLDGTTAPEAREQLERLLRKAGRQGELPADLRLVEVRAHNLRRLRVHPGVDAVFLVDVDESGAVLAAAGTFLVPAGGPVDLLWDGKWRVAGPVPETEKRPERTGPFKRAFDHGFAFVTGTAGSAQETAELADRARALALEWAYRANGYAPVLTDREFLEHGHDGNLVLLGNADTNAAWDAALATDAPLRAMRGALLLGDELLEGDDLACLAVLPRRGRDDRLVAVVGDSGPAGTRLHAVTAPFTSGVGIPDYLVFDGRVLTDGDGGVLAAGWFDHRWRLPSSGR